MFWGLNDFIDYDNYEKREYAKFPEISIQTIGDFPTQFENFYNDWLPFKNQLKRIKSKIEIKLAKYESSYMLMNGKHGVICGENDWLFYITSEFGTAMIN